MGTYISNISIKDYKGFKDVHISCSKDDGSFRQWTLLLGENNTGKTRILKSIAGLIQDKLNSDNASVTFTGDAKPKVFGYGVTRYTSSSPNIRGVIVDDFATLQSSDARLVDIEDCILQISLGEKNGDDKARRLNELFANVICKNEGLFPEIFAYRVESNFNPGSLVSNRVLFQTKDGWFPYSELGFGYQSMLSWVVDFCYRMAQYYPYSDNPLLLPAVVLIDEIDLHLHPRWQRSIAPLLSATFPNVQFIATTHSPFVIQSMDDVNLYVLNRAGTDVNISPVPIRDFRGWSVEEILEDVMSLNENINSNYLNGLLAEFDRGLDTEDKVLVEKSYSELCNILPANSNTRRIVTMQKKKIDRI